MKCKLCGKEFARHNTLQVRCYECELKLKKEKDANKKTITQDVDSRFLPKVYSSETNRRKRKEEKSESKKNAIANRSKSQEGKDREIARIKAERIRRYGPYCESCGSPHDIDLAHIIPKSIRPDLYLVLEATMLHCRYGCGPAWEHLQDMERVRRFINLDVIMAYLEKTDIKRFNRVNAKLNELKNRM